MAVACGEATTTKHPQTEPPTCRKTPRRGRKARTDANDSHSQSGWDGWHGNCYTRACARGSAGAVCGAVEAPAAGMVQIIVDPAETRGDNGNVPNAIIDKRQLMEILMKFQFVVAWMWEGNRGEASYTVRADSLAEAWGEIVKVVRQPGVRSITLLR